MKSRFLKIFFIVLIFSGVIFQTVSASHSGTLPFNPEDVLSPDKAKKDALHKAIYDYLVSTDPTTGHCWDASPAQETANNLTGSGSTPGSITDWFINNKPYINHCTASTGPDSPYAIKPVPEESVLASKCSINFTPDLSYENRTNVAYEVATYVYCHDSATNPERYSDAKNIGLRIAALGGDLQKAEWDKYLAEIKARKAAGQDLSGMQEKIAAGNVAIAKKDYTAPPDEEKCTGPWSSWTPGCIAISALAEFGNALIVIFGWLLALAGLIFELALKISVQEMHTIATLPAIALGWTVSRDFANLLFIFTLLYIAIGTILDLNGINTGKMVGMVILSALLINFSLAITKVVIDVGNAPALFFYQTLAKGGQSSLSDVIVAGLKIQNITGLAPDPHTGTVGQVTATDAQGNVIKTSGAPATGELTFTHVIAATLGGIIVILVASFILLVTGALFLARLLFLIFLMILSPMAFLGLAFKPLKELWDWWKKSLYDNVFFAPAYMAVFAIALLLITALGKYQMPIPDTLGFSDDLLRLGNQVLAYFLICYVLVYTLTIAKRFSAWGSSAVISKATSYKNSVQGWAARNTVGKAAWKLSNTKAVRNFDAKYGGGLITKGLDTAGSAKYGGKLGYKEARDTSIKNKQKTAQRLMTNTETEETTPEIAQVYGETLGRIPFTQVDIPFANAGTKARGEVAKNVTAAKVKAGYTAETNPDGTLKRDTQGNVIWTKPPEKSKEDKEKAAKKKQQQLIDKVRNIQAQIDARKKQFEEKKKVWNNQKKKYEDINSDENMRAEQIGEHERGLEVLEESKKKANQQLGLYDEKEDKK